MASAAGLRPVEWTNTNISNTVFLDALFTNINHNHLQRFRSLGHHVTNAAANRGADGRVVGGVDEGVDGGERGAAGGGEAAVAAGIDAGSSGGKGVSRAKPSKPLKPSEASGPTGPSGHSRRRGNDCNEEFPLNGYLRTWCIFYFRDQNTRVDVRAVRHIISHALARLDGHHLDGQVSGG
jgi:hypothetical protein